MDPLNVDIDWDQLSVGSNESFFRKYSKSMKIKDLHDFNKFPYAERKHPAHEPQPLMTKTLLKSAIEKWTQDVNKQTERQSRATNKENKPVATIRPRGKSLPRKPPNTVPVTPNVLKKRIQRPLQAFAFKPEPYVFKAKPAPKVHKPIHQSCGNLPKAGTSHHAPVRALTKDMNRLNVNVKKPSAGSTGTVVTKKPTEDKENKHPVSKNKFPTTTTTTSTIRSSRSQVKKTETDEPQPRVRSNSVPGRGKSAGPVSRATIPVTPMVLKRVPSRTRLRTNSEQSTQSNTGPATNHCPFKAKPADVLHRKPFKPKLATNHNGDDAKSGGQPPMKPFAFRLEDRIKDRQTFNHRAEDAFDRKQKLVHEAKKKSEDERYVAARKLTVFRANPNPFK